MNNLAAPRSRLPGTGSFGSTMVQKLLSHNVGRINIFSRDEAKQDAMRRRSATSG